MIRKASYGEKFYSTIEQQACLGGAGAIGLRDMPPKLASGEKYFELGRFKDLETAKAATEKLSIIKERYWGIVYSPLDEATFKPDVVLIITEPVGGMKLAQTIVYSSGDKVRPNFAGIQSLCGDALANPFITGGVNFTLGCDGSRNAADIKDNEMTIGISGEKLEEVISNHKSYRITLNNHHNDLYLIIPVHFFLLYHKKYNHHQIFFLKLDLNYHFHFPNILLNYL